MVNNTIGSNALIENTILEASNGSNELVSDTKGMAQAFKTFMENEGVEIEPEHLELLGHIIQVNNKEEENDNVIEGDFSNYIANELTQNVR